MPKFAYEARTSAGQITKGEIDAANQAAAMIKLRTKQLQPLRVQAKGGLNFKMELKIPLPKFLQPGVKQKDLAIFTKQLATMIDAGLPLVQAIDLLANQQKNTTFKSTLTAVRESVEGGATFADSLRKHPKVFDDLYVNLVQAGEVGGILDTIMERLSTYIEKIIKLKGQIKGAMVYPGVILSVAAVVVSILLVYVIPIFAKMFEDFGQALPAPTQFVIKLSYWLKGNIVLLIIGIFASMAAFRFIYRRPTGRRVIDDVFLRIPVIGDLIRKIAVSRFTRTMGTMISSGVPILDGLDICAKTSGNKTIERALYMVKAGISQGKTIAEPLKETKVFPDMVVHMIAVGESTGALDAMMNKIADFYEEEVDKAVETLTSLMEPAMMVFLGIVIGGLVIAMYLPIFSMAGAIG